MGAADSAARYRAHLDDGAVHVVPARQALVVFESLPQFTSFRGRPTMRAPKWRGDLRQHQLLTRFSSVFPYYANTRGWLLKRAGEQPRVWIVMRRARPQVFLDDAEFAERWRRPELHYLLVEGPSVPRIEGLVGKAAMHVVVKTSGGKFLFANRLVQ
jgi:hypothetical protein